MFSVFFALRTACGTVIDVEQRRLTHRGYNIDANLLIWSVLPGSSLRRLTDYIEWQLTMSHRFLRHRRNYHMH